MEKIDNFKIEKIYKGNCPFNFEKALEKNPKKFYIIHGTKKFDKEHYKKEILLYKEDYNKDQFIKQPCLKIEIYKYLDNFRITISNSIRKWFFGDNSTRDFNQKTLMICLEEISNLLLLNVEDLLCFKIHQIELGVTFRLPKEYKLLLPNLCEHKDFKKYGQFNNFSTVYFNAIDLGIKCYDVLQKLFDYNQISKKVYEKLSSKYFFLRLELRINKRSDVYFADKNMNTLKDLITNKNKIIKYWISTMNKIEVQEEICLELANTLKDLSPKDIKDYGANKYREKITWAKFNFLLDVTIKNDPKKKYAIKKSFRQIQENWRFAKKTNNKEIFKKIISSVK